MSSREQCYAMMDMVPDYKIGYVLAFLQGLTAGQSEEPNAATLEAFEELDNGGGHRFSGTTEDLFADLMED